MAGKLMDEMLKRKPDVLLSSGGLPALIVKERAPLLPVVFDDVPDPVGIGLVQSLARPGTNMTGLANITRDLYGKRAQLLKEALPGIRLISTLSTTDSPTADQSRNEVERAAGRLGWRVRHSTVKPASDLPGAFQAMKNDGTEAFIILLRRQSSGLNECRSPIWRRSIGCPACTRSQRKWKQAGSSATGRSS
jgi:putative ABC transport system substrate-binding protein